MKPIYIAAYHQSVFGKLFGLTVPEIVEKAITDVCKEIGAEAAAIDALLSYHIAQAQLERLTARAPVTQGE